MVRKTGEPEMVGNVLDATSEWSLARGIVVSGTTNAHVLRADARYAWKEGVLVAAEALEGN